MRPVPCDADSLRDRLLAAGVVGVTSPLTWLWLPTLAWRFLGDVPFYNEELDGETAPAAAT